MRNFEPDVIIALGGGSPIDAAKGMWLFYEYPDADPEGMKLKFMDIRKRTYKFPYDTYKAELKVDDIGLSDRVVLIGVDIAE